MNKKLLRSVREYKKQSILAPLLVILEVLMEVLIPLEMAKIIDIGIAQGNLSYILQRGIILVVMAMLSLFFGVLPGLLAPVLISLVQGAGRHAHLPMKYATIGEKRGDDIHFLAVGLGSSLHLGWRL